MRHRAFTWIEFTAVLVILCVLAAVLPVIFSREDRVPRGSQCKSNLKQIGLGFQQYIQDYDGKFPAVATSGEWANAVQPYIKSWQVFHCPSAQSNRDEQTTDYGFNARLSGAKQEKIADAGISILMADGLSAQPPDYSLSQLPDAWRADEKSPAWRHTGMANYLFADGHVKPLKPQQITLDKPSAGNPTFLVGEK